MSKKKLAIIILVFATILINIFILGNVDFGTTKENPIYLQLDAETEEDVIIHAYYSKSNNYTSEPSHSIAYNHKDGRVKLNFPLETDIGYIKLEYVTGNNTLTIHDVKLNCANFSNTQYLKQLQTTTGDVTTITYQYSETKAIKAFDKSLWTLSLIINIIICLIIDAIVIYILRRRDTVAEIPLEVVREKKLILTLAKNDFKTRYAGSYLGIIWAFIQPIVTVLVYWFVFEKGLRAGRMCDYPFILWLMCGLVPWFYFADALNGATNALVEYSYLVKKVVFKISILPFVKVLSNIFIHMFFVVFVVILHVCYGYTPDLYWLQLIYYIACTFVLVLGIAYLTSALVVFFRDLTQIISIILQIGMWATPIMWDASQYSKVLDLVMKINPMYYIVQGYRNTLLGDVGFWTEPYWTLYFWIFVVAMFLLGQSIFKKLRVHFADVL